MGIQRRIDGNNANSMFLNLFIKNRRGISRWDKVGEELMSIMELDLVDYDIPVILLTEYTRSAHILYSYATSR